MVGDYFNQTASLVKTLTIDEYNAPATTSTTAILCRKESKLRLLRTVAGENILSESVVYTESVLAQGDRIDGRVVVLVETANDLDGSILFYRGFLS